MDLDQYNDVELRLFHFEIFCKGVVREDIEDSEPMGVRDDGTIVTHTETAYLETTGGKCIDLETKEERIFPAGIYRLSKDGGIEKIGEIKDDTEDQ